MAQHSAMCVCGLCGEDGRTSETVAGHHLTRPPCQVYQSPPNSKPKFKEEKTDSERLASRVQELVRLGAVGRAARLATSTLRVVEPTEAVRRSLEALHPQGVQPEVLPVCDRTAITTETVRKAILLLSKGASPGLV